MTAPRALCLLRVALPGALAAACGAPARPASTPPPSAAPPSETVAPPSSTAGPAASAPSDCGALQFKATERLEAGDPAGVGPLVEPKLAACHGHGLHDLLGRALAQQQRLEDAAVHYIAELRDPHPPPRTFADLDAIYDQLSAARKAEVATVGTSESQPLRVPTIRFEHAWVGRFACPDGKGNVKTQALIRVAAGELDELTFVCPDGTTHEAYFDFSDDPTTKALEKELQDATRQP